MPLAIHRACRVSIITWDCDSLGRVHLYFHLGWRKEPFSCPPPKTSTIWDDTNGQTKGPVRSATACAAPLTIPVAASPLLPSVGSPWSRPMQPPQNILASGSGGDDDTSNAMNPDDKELWVGELGRAVSPLSTPTTLHEEEEAFKVSLSPTESRTTCSSYSIAEQHVAATTTTQRQPKKVMHSPGRRIIEPSTTSRRSRPEETRVLNAPPQPHAFVSSSPEETSDPEEQRQRREARAREQQQLISWNGYKQLGMRREPDKTSPTMGVPDLSCVCLCVN